MTDETIAVPVVRDAAELEQAKQDFMAGYGALVEKHKVDFAQYPVWVPDGAGAFKTVIQNAVVDMSQQPQKSPFIATE